MNLPRPPAVLKVSVLLVFIAGFSYRASGDIWGSTTLACSNGDPGECPSLNIGSSVQASFWDAFTSAITFLETLDEALDGSVVATYESYGQFEDFLRTVQDKTAARRERIVLDKTAGYDRITLVFEVFSDDDPFQQPIRAAVPPNTAGIGIARYSSDDRRHRIVSVELRPKQIPDGTYAIAFWAKEDDCHTCLSIAHTILITVTKPCVQPNVTCRQSLNTASQAGIKLSQYQQEFRDLMKAASKEIRDNIRRQKSMDKGCDWKLEPTKCDNETRAALKNMCASVALGANPIYCQKLTELDGLIRRYTAESDRATREIGRRGCCYVYKPDTGSDRPNER